MQKIFIRYMSAVVIVALLAILAMNWGLQEFNARNRMMENSEMKLDQIVQTLENNEVELQNLKDSLSEDYLTRAKAAIASGAFKALPETLSMLLGAHDDLPQFRLKLARLTPTCLCWISILQPGRLSHGSRRAQREGR